ncbi:MAG: DNA repair protein RecN [Bacilli bacterium]|jgi:DNA repair protein RecN (Recombination protein N)|nr:DNA repair protein RecN [Bacilli bacterium]
MLLQISIKNFAIIEKMNIDFSNGLTIITGQTGAGKSIVIDAIEQLLGRRASSTLVGHHDELATIEGIFECNNKITNYLKDNDIELEDDVIIINKKIYKDGKSQLRLNNKIITLDIIRNMANLLIEIISQNSTTSINSNDKQLEYIDSFFNDVEKEKLNEYYLIFKEYNKTKNEYNDFLTNKVDDNLLEYYQNQLNDINDNYIDKNELEELNEKESYYNQFETINENLQKIILLFKNNNILDNLFEITMLTNKLSEINSNLDNINNQINDNYYNLNNIYEQLVNELNNLNFDENELETLKSKLFNYQIMAKKYSYSDAIIEETRNDLINKIDFINNSSSIKEKYLNKIKDYENKLITLAEIINKFRIKYINDIENNISKQLNNLYLKDARFKIKTFEDNLKESGNFKVEFLFSANKGIELKPMNSIASGGELSRLLLALKSIKMIKDDVLYIFDEIDVGVSGQVANAVGKTMKDLSLNNNIIAITHLPQVAAYANHHLYIEKDNTKNITTSNCYYLNKEQQIEEIAKMISSEKVTKSSLIHARELIDNAQK